MEMVKQCTEVKYFCCPLILKDNLLNDNRLLKKHWFKFFQEIKTVDNQLKPAWLNDFLDVDIELIRSALQWLSQKNFIFKQLEAIEISHDLLVVDIQTVIKTISKTLQSLNEGTDSEQLLFCLVEDKITSIFDQNYVKNELTACLQGILSEIKDSQKNFCKSISVNCGTFTPTIFGILLGYPVVYVQGRDLSYPLTLNLTVWTFTFKICKESSHKPEPSKQDAVVVYYSFSFPTAVELTAAQRFVFKNWKCQIIDRCVANGFDYSFCESKKLNANVIL